MACLVAVPLLVIAGIALLQLSPQLPLAGRYVGLCVVAYLTGSISWGYMVLVIARGEDIRDFGSGRTGMSNMLRTGGGKSAAVVFVLDCSKGILAVLLARYTIGVGAPELVAGLAVLCGHNWPVFLRFRGGRGILPSLGTLAVMAPWVALAGAVLFIIITLSSRYLSLGSIVGVMFIALLSLGANPLVGASSNLHGVRIRGRRGHNLAASGQHPAAAQRHRAPGGDARIAKLTAGRIGRRAQPSVTGIGERVTILAGMTET